ncbi:MAG: tetratricopeptide repeat protein [Candidatus Mcinerneyibacterium aminivorans]|uniref:Tetratricopeptide repeat protein n=1 Tax=Candidatus Mcinerneyibacterium aminivorans TaxID=2703815 RepID=A0A5D0MHD5_9BACT|nr:MAG: tetratricopeptide repeat protein [Candidatus Mcinerneyibacterium aminivorans]
MKFIKKIFRYIRLLPKLIKAKYYTKKANKELQKGNLEKAKDYYLKVEKMDLINYMIYHNVGSIFFQLRDFDKAEEYFKKAIDLNPKNVVSYSTLSEVYLRKKRWKDAEDIIEKALEIEPFNYFLKKRKKKIFNKNWRKNYVESLEKTEKALNQQQKGNIKEAKESFEKAVKLNNKNTTAHFLYGTMLYNQGNYDKAIKHVSMAVEFSNNKRYSAVLNQMQKELNEKNIKKPK